MEKSHSVPELAKAVSLAGNVEGLPELLGDDIEGLSGIKRALRQRPVEPLQPVVPQTKREFSVTELDLYLRCPYDYLVARVLGLEPLEEVTEDISPMDRGSKVHWILRDFYLSWGRPVTGEDRDEARALLRKLADKAFEREADTFRNRREKELFLSVMAERFLDAEEAFWKQGMRPVYLEQTIECFPLVLSNGEAVGLSAKIDRIDADASGNYLIVDYKTGKYPLPKMNADQDIFQLPVYAVMAQTGLTGGAVLNKPIGLVYYDLAGKTGAGARDVVLFDKEARSDHPSSKPKASPKNQEEFEEILRQAMIKAKRAVEGILAGDFAAKPRDEAECRYCTNTIMCGRRET
jgi:ATP-dependent helicase/nuclease subunit B